MICKKCSAEYDSKDGICSECGFENTEAFVSSEKNAEVRNKKAVPVKKARLKPAKKSGTVFARQTQVKTQKRATAAIAVIMCLVAVLTAGLTAVNILTDVFDEDESTEKVVAGVGLTSQQEKDLEDAVAKVFSVAKNEFDRQTSDAEALIARIRPSDKGDTCLRLNDTAAVLQTEPDPAERFADEDGEYAYYRLEESKVDKLLDLFGEKSYRGENGESFYYCDGYYYFSADEVKETPVVSFEVTKSRRVLDGSYYAEGYFYLEKGRETVKTDAYHLVIELNEGAADGESLYRIRKISTEPIFGSDGKLVGSETTYEIKTEVIEGYTDDGLLFGRYVIEYPVIIGESEGCNNVNEFFRNAVSVYELKAQSAQQLFEDFRQNGGDEEALPVAENITFKVAFEDENNISFVTRIASMSAEAEDDKEEGAKEALYKTAVEAYTVDKASGNFVSKDSILGKNYLLVSELLYRIYNGYDYENLLPDASDDEYYYDETPDDTDELGITLYEGAWSLTEKGVAFYYVTEEGYVKEVTIPYAVVSKIKE